MEILFIYSVESTLSIEKPLYSQSFIQFGLSYLSSFLKQFNHDTKLLILSRGFGNKNYDIIRKKIEDFKPKIIGFYSVEPEYKFISTISKFVKSNYPEIFSILGGPHATLNPDEVIKDDFDAICIGEGTTLMGELTKALEKKEYPSNIKNLWIKKDGIIEKNEIAPFAEELDSFPFPDRVMWDEHIDYKQNFLDQNISVLIGLGCPFSCTYCSNHALRKITDGVYVRYRSPENIVKELKSIHETYPLENSIFLQIESFNVNTEWAIEVCNEIEKYNKTLDKPLSFRLNIRITPKANFDSLFEACKRANILDLNIGLESGSERVRRDILKRNYSNDDVIKTVNIAKKYGLTYNFYVMMGIPGETIEDFKETIKICRICQPKEVLEYIFYPYPGTDLYKLCENMNLFHDKIDIKIERMQAILNLPGFTRRQIQSGFIWFNYNVYKGYKPRTELLLKVLIKLFRSNPFIILIASKLFNSYLIIKLKKYMISFYFKQPLAPASTKTR